MPVPVHQSTPNFSNFLDISDLSTNRLRAFKSSIRRDKSQRPLFLRIVRLLSKRYKQSFFSIAEDIFSTDHGEDAVLPSKQSIVEYFSEIYAPQDEITLPPVVAKPILTDFDLSPITVEELCDCVSSLKLDSATGPGHVSNKQIKRLCASDPQSLCNYFNSLDFKPASNFGHSVCTLVYKKGECSDPSNYRPIAVTPSLSRLYNKILARRLDKFILANNIVDTSTQKGFISGKRGCIEHTFWLQTLCEKNAFISLVDLKNAYGSVPHKLLFHVLKQFGLPGKFRNYISLLYASLSTRFRTPQGLTKPVLCYRGLFQGDTLSPLLFLLCLEPVLQQYRKKFSDSIILALADDVSLISLDSATSHKERLDFFSAIADASGFTVSLPKTFSFRCENGSFYKLVSSEQSHPEQSDSEQSHSEQSDSEHQLYTDNLVYLGSCLNAADSVVKVKFLDYLNKLKDVDYISPHFKCKLVYKYIIPALYYKLQVNTLKISTITDLDNILCNFLDFLANTPGYSGRSESLRRLAAAQYHRKVFLKTYKWLQSLRCYFLLQSDLCITDCSKFACSALGTEFLNLAILSEEFKNPKLFIKNFYFKNELNLGVFEYFLPFYV